MARVLLLTLLVAVAAASASPLLQEAYPDPWTPGEPEEFVTVTNPGPAAVNLSGWVLSDGEGDLTFPPGTPIPPGGNLTVARNATAYRAAILAWPDFEIENSAPEVPDVASSGNFRLSNGGDKVLLRSPDGAVVDSLAYGSSSGAPGWVGPPVKAPPEGALLHRWGVDTDTAADWNGPRLLRAGQTRFAPDSFDLENATLFTSPEAALAEVIAFVRAARERLVVEVYEFDHRLLARELADAVKRGVRVDLLLEGSPVGGVPSRSLLGNLADAGVNVTLLQTPRYRFSHAKFAAADGRAVLLMTENWNAAGLPANLRGNRGWGLKAENGSLAARLEEVARLDGTLRPGDSLGRIDQGGPAAWVASEPPEPGTVLRAGNLTARLVLGPESGPGEVRELVRSARERVDVLQQTVDPNWGDGPSPLLSELLRAAGRGVRVRVLYQYGDLSGFQKNAKAVGLPVEVRPFAPHGRILAPHAKGVVADGRVFLSSFNWNENSFTNNREAGLILENVTAAAFFAASFEEDWQAAGATGVPWWPFAVAALLLLSYLWWRRRRR